MILKLISVLILLETGNGVKDNGNAIGPLQLKPVFVREVNRITGSDFKHEDARNEELAKMMVHAYLRYHRNRLMERGYAVNVYDLALIFRYGPKGRRSKGLWDNYGLRAVNLFYDEGT